jgi:hypothetical protein
MGIHLLSSLLKDKGENISLSDIAQKNKGLVVLVDGNAVAHRIVEQCALNASPETSLLPHYSTLSEKIEKFIHSLSLNNIKTFWYFDSFDKESLLKINEMIRRQDERIEILINAVEKNTLERVHSSQFLMAQTFRTLNRLGVDIVPSEGEADYKLCKDFPEKKAFAIISRDSDFFLVPDIGYIPFDSIVINGLNCGGLKSP